MADPICHQTRDQASNAIAREPDSCSRGHFISGPPAGGYEHERRCYTSFGYSKEESNGDQPSIIGTRSRERHHDAPEKGIDDKILCDRHASHEQCCRVFPEEIAKVEHRADPGILLAVEVLSITASAFRSTDMFASANITHRILPQAKHTGAGQDGLVHEVEIVCDEHQRQ